MCKKHLVVACNVLLCTILCGHFWPFMLGNSQLFLTNELILDSLELNAVCLYIYA